MKQVEYRIMTEAKRDLDKIVSKYFDAFSLNIGTGYWKGNREGAAQIDIVTDDTPENQTKIRSLAKEIQKTNQQEAVLTLRYEIYSELIH